MKSRAKPLGRAVKIVDHENWIAKQLKNSDFAAEYLKAASEEDDPRIDRIALKHILKVRRQS